MASDSHPGQNDNERGQSEETGTPVGVLDLALILAKNVRLLVAAPLLLAATAFAIAWLMPATYTSTARILPPSQHHSGAAMLAAQLGAVGSVLGVGANGVASSVDQYASLLRSRSVQDAVIEKFSLREKYEVAHIEDARSHLEDHVRIGSNAKEGIIFIEVADEDPKQAAAMANAFVDALRDLTNRLAVSEAGRRRLFFETQLKSIKTSLTNAEIALRQSGVSAATLKTVPQSTLEELARLKAQISAQEIRLSAMRSYMTEANPELRIAIQELAALRTELAKHETSTTTSSAGAEYISRFREFKYFETLFELMAKQYELARLDEAREGSIVQVIDIAQVPEKRTGPKPLLVAILTWMLATFLVGVFVIVLHLTTSDGRNVEKLSRITAHLAGRR